MSKMLSLSSGSSFGATRAPRALRGSSMSSRAFLVSDSGDDYEMSGEFAHTLLRFSDRLTGFLIGGGVLAAIWAVWLLS